MQILKRIIFYPVILLFLNAVLLFNFSGRLGVPLALRVLVLALLSALFIYYAVKPAAAKDEPLKQRILIGGYELIVACGVFLAVQITQIILYISKGLIPLENASGTVYAVNALFSLAFIVALLFNGMIRVAVTSKQLSVTMKALMFSLWWVSMANIIIFVMACKTVKEEYKFLRAKRLRNKNRKAAQVCATRYPVLMVHGIFFRDWKVFNYWGRIPQELTDNGARIFYGNHNSALQVEQAGEELKNRILDILRETGCEKVHIIGHSKGGLDARYAISCLGMDKYVASLTTINTPHRGTPLAGKLLQLVPDKAVSAVGRQYGKLFSKLGDDNCDFMGSVNGLTPERCDELNRIMPDREGVLYQSVGSMMRAVSSAGPPLNAGYAIIKPMGGDNDGLVCIDSMPWGHNLGILEPAKKKGISHGDMIDMTRKNIPGFDVCEFYVGLVSGLKEKGM